MNESRLLVEKEEVFVFLDKLQASGEVNMFGAIPYVQNAFFVEKPEASELWKEWTETYHERHADDE